MLASSSVVNYIDVIYISSPLCASPSVDDLTMTHDMRVCILPVCRYDGMLASYPYCG